MKPWEETWEAHPRAGEGARLYSDGHEEEWATAWGADSNARAKLAAAAPEMARLLLDHAVGTECSFCGQDAQMYTGKLDIAEHRVGCPLVAVLRKAGCAP